MTGKIDSIDKSALLVLGMHRSGTSALARALSYCGFALPKDLLPPQVDNPKGFWEPRAVVRLNEGILAALGGSWDKPGPFLLPEQTLSASRERLSRAIAGRWLADAVDALKASFGGANAIVLKDPRIALFLPLWRAALAEAGYAAHTMLVFRNPLEVAASLRARNDLPARRSLLLWQTYNLQALIFSPDVNVAAVSYERLLERPAETIGCAFEDLALCVEPPGSNAAAAMRGLLAPDDRHHASSADDLFRAPVCAGQIREMWKLLDGWNSRAPRIRKKAVAALAKAFDEAIIFAGSPRRLGPQPLRMLGLESEAVATQREKRLSGKAEAYDAKNCPLVLHYHFFKNAGTSVDEILIRNFGSRWATEEFSPCGMRSNVAAVQAYLREKPDLLALSSHTALLPVPDLGGRKVIPVIFIRHPVDRLKSAYAFERRQTADTVGSRLAKEKDFVGYLRELLELRANGQARNFQAHRLAFNEPSEAGSEEERALRTLGSLEFVGLVEAFEASMERLVVVLRTHFVEFEPAQVRKNVTRRKNTLAERLAEIRSEIGEDLYAELVAANGSDLRIFEAVSVRYAGIAVPG
jgi:hypothetical protein